MKIDIPVNQIGSHAEETTMSDMEAEQEAEKVIDDIMAESEVVKGKLNQTRCYLANPD